MGGISFMALQPVICEVWCLMMAKYDLTLLSNIRTTHIWI